MRIFLSDHREAIGDFSQFLVKLDVIELHLSGQPIDEAWIAMEAETRQIDLTHLVGGEVVQVLEQRLPAVAYDAIRVNLTGVRGTLLTGEEIELEEFSATSRLQFHLAADETVGLLVDLKVQSRHDHPGDGYVLLLSDTKMLRQASTE